MQVATVVMMAFGDTETGTHPATKQKQQETQRQRNGRLILKKARFNWDMVGRFVELLNFQPEVTNILETRVLKISDEERILIIMNWLDQEGLLLMEIFMQEEKEKCKPTKGLFPVLSSRFKPCHNHVIISLYYQNLQRKTKESAK